MSYPPETNWEFRGQAIEWLYHNCGFSSTATSRYTNAVLKDLIARHHHDGWDAWLLSVTNVTHNL